MRTKTKLVRRGTILGVAACCALFAALTGTAVAAPQTLTFQEIEKGSTFAYIDNAPKSKLVHGFPEKISQGDEISISTPLASAGKTIGKLRTSCVATSSAKTFDKAGFNCLGTFVFSNGTLVASAVISKESGTEGAIIGGTGVYANARGTFVSVEGKGTSTVTVTLVE